MRDRLFPQSAIQRAFAAVGLIALLFIFLRWLITLNELSNPVPFCDDFGAILRFLVDWKADGDFELLFSKYQESRVFLSRALVALHVGLSGYPVDFERIASLAWVAPFILVGLFSYFLWKHSGFELGETLFLSIPASLLVFHTGPFGLYLWPQSGLTHGVVVPVAMGALLLLHAKRYIASILLLCLAAVSAGGGVLLLPAMILSRVEWRGLGLKRFLVFSTTGALALFLLLNFSSDVLYGSHNSLRFFLEQDASLSKAAVFAFTLLGSFFSFNDPLPAFWIGLVAAALWFALTHFCLPRNTVLSGLGYFLLFVAFATAVLRSANGSQLDAITSRYHYYSATLIALNYLCLLKSVKHSVLGRRIFCSLCILCLSYWQFENSPRVEQRVRDFHLQQLQRVVLSRFFKDVEVPNAHRPFIDELLAEAEEAGVYSLRFDEHVFRNVIERNVILPDGGAEIVYLLDERAEDELYWVARGFAVIQAAEFHVPVKSCLIAEEIASDENIRVCFPSDPSQEVAGTVRERYGVERGQKAAVQFIFPKYLFSRSHVRIGIMSRGKKNWHLQWLEEPEDPAKDAQ